MADFTPTQGRYLAFIHAYTNTHGYPPAESEIALALCVSPPSVNQMVKKLEERGLIRRQPGQPRSLQIIIPEEEIPAWKHPQAGKQRSPSAKKSSGSPAAPAVNLYVLLVFLQSGPVSGKFANKEISRKIEIRGDQTLEDLHEILFEAYDREEEHMYEFQFGKRPFDPEAPRYGPAPLAADGEAEDASTTKLDDLDLKKGRVFGYWFDFGDNWYHQVRVERIERAIPTVSYPRIIKRVGKSPPQYPAEE